MGDAQECIDKCLDIAKWRPLRKPKFVKVKAGINPNSKGLNLYLKCVKAPEAVEGSPDLKEVLAGDDTGVVLSIRSDTYADVCKEGTLLRVQNATVKMVKGYIRLVVDKWGILKADVDAATAGFETVDEKTNVSKTEYELV